MTYHPMGVEAVLCLAKELREQNSTNFHTDLIDDYLTHLADAYAIAGETTDDICGKYPELRSYLNAEEIALAGGLHDIGRPLRKNQLFHELRGAAYIEEYGLEKGVAETTVDVFRIAQMFRPHFLVAEQFYDPENENEIAEFQSLRNSPLLMPRTWQEAIVAYSELKNIRGKKISVQNRIADIKKRYTNNPKYNSNTSLLRAMDQGLSRIIATCERVEKLKHGEMTEPQIFRYGFL